ncbi:hypothetical protein HKD37_11G031418 [Glycine soja]
MSHTIFLGLTSRASEAVGPNSLIKSLFPVIKPRVRQIIHLMRCSPIADHGDANKINDDAVVPIIILTLKRSHAFLARVLVISCALNVHAIDKKKMDGGFQSSIADKGLSHISSSPAHRRWYRSSEVNRRFNPIVKSCPTPEAILGKNRKKPPTTSHVGGPPLLMFLNCGKWRFLRSYCRSLTKEEFLKIQVDLATTRAYTSLEVVEEHKKVFHWFRSYNVMTTSNSDNSSFDKDSIWTMSGEASEPTYNMIIPPIPLRME